MKHYCSITGLLFMLTVSISVAQDNAGTDTRQVVLNSADSVIYVKILITRSVIKPNLSKIYFWYTPDRIHSNLGDFSGYLLHGEYNVFDSQKHLVVKGSFSEGLKTGIWKRWYLNGNLSEIATWDKGSLNGISIFFDPNGNIINQVKYRNGKLIEKNIDNRIRFKITDRHKSDSLI